MAMRYAHRDDVLAQLKLDPNNASDTAAIERVERLERALADTFDAKVGRSFGGELAPVAETRTAYGDDGAMLRLQPAALMIDTVAVGGTWDGASWADETVLDADAWQPVWRGSTVIALIATDGVWSGPVRVTATWTDQQAEGVPDDVRSALTFLTVDQYRIETSSPTGEIGLNGLLVRPRNPWSYELVTTTIARHRVRRLKVGL